VAAGIAANALDLSAIKWYTGFPYSSLDWNP
jgi:hypothetical protein